MSTPTILIVEDEIIIAEVIRDTLEAAGFGACACVASVPDALSALDAGEWRGALLDIRLNGDFVFPVAEKLHARGLPFAFCTGDGDNASIPAAFAHAPILAKPWGTGQLERVANDIFGAPG